MPGSRRGRVDSPELLALGPGPGSLWQGVCGGGVGWGGGPRLEPQKAQPNPVVLTGASAVCWVLVPACLGHTPRLPSVWSL